MEEQDPLGILNQDPLGILKKKEVTGSASVGPSSAVPSELSGQVDAPTAESKSKILPFGYDPTFVDRTNKSNAAKSKQEAEDKKKNLVQYYDKAAPIIDGENGFQNVYKNWAAENGSLERINYLEDKARNEVEIGRRGLSNVVGFMKKLQEDKRAAVAAGDIDEYERLNKLIQSGTEHIRSNKDVVEAGLKTESGLRLHEEAIGFSSEMLNAKMEDLLKNPDTEKKLTRLNSLYTELKNSKPKEGESPERYNNLIEQYNSLLQDEDVSKVKKVAEQGEKLIASEKNLAFKYPNEFQKRLEKKNKQFAIDAMFDTNPQIGVVGGMAMQVGRSATGFVADLLKSWTLLDRDNKFGAEDKWNSAIDATVNYINEETLPVPSDYSKPMMYQDEEGNSIFRSDLILPKTAKVAGDMAALLFGAGKLSALGKAAGLSQKVSQGIGLFTSSYIQTFDDYKKAGESAGLNPSDAAWFASAASTTTSALELISPNRYLWSPEDVASNVAKNIASGMSRKQALSESIKFVGKQIGAENLQEITQQMGDILVESGVNSITGNNHFENSGKDILNEAVETMVVTTLVAGLPASGAKALTDRNENYRDAIRLAAENKEKYLPILQQHFKEIGADPAEIKKVMSAINAVKVPQAGAPLYLINNETVDRAAVLEKIKSGDLSGVYVANDVPLEQQLKTVSNGGKVNGTPKVNVKHEKEKSADGKVKVEDPADFAKRVAKAKIEELVKTGDLKYDGKRVTVLTEKGGQQLAMIMDEMNRPNKVTVKGKTEKADPALDAAMEKQNSGQPLSLEETQLLESIQDPPKLKENKTAKTQGFFTSVVEGTEGKFIPKAPWSPIMKFDGQESFKDQYDKYNGNFDQHIATSIPGFRDVQIKKGAAISNMLPEGGLMYDISGSEGGLVKSITQTTGGKVKTINLDINEAMKKSHESSPVQGSEFVNEAFLEQYEENGKVFPRHVPKAKADVVHESMVFQFISPERQQFIEEIKKNYIKPDGVLILEEKVVPESEQEWMANEDKKDTAFKSKYYSTAELQQKKEAVLTGMKQNQTADADLQAELKKNFAHVYQYWDSGNFKGYVASNDRTKIESFVKGLGDTTTEFSTRESGYITEKENPDAKRIATIMDKAKASLSSIRPDLAVVPYNGATEGKMLAGKLPEGAVGFYDHAKGVIGIDMSQADATTAFHEAFHPIVDALKSNNPELFEKLSQQAAAQKIELADGSSQTYGEYMQGNKEEALVEFLADFADGRFDGINEKSIANTIRDIIDQILKALGLTSADFNVDLTKLDNLKAFADQMATAISKGKTINFEAKSKAMAEVSAQVPGKKKKKLNRTAKRIAFDKQTEFKELQVDIVTNPEDYSYTPQDLKNKKKDLQNMTLDEVVIETESTERLLKGITHNNQYAVLSALELLRRKNAAGEDTRPIFKQLREVGTGIGQLLRQFGELKSRTPEGIVNTVLGNLESLNLTPTEEQTKALTKLAQDHIKALNDVDAKRIAFINDPTDSNETALKQAEDAVAKSFYDLNTYVGKVTPLGLDTMIPTILQGNLLTSKSIVTNVVSNLIQQPLRQGELMAGDLTSYVVNKMKGEHIANPLEMYFGSMLHGIMAFGHGVPVAIRDVIRGRGAEYISTLEVRRNLKPLQALQQIFTKAGRATLPVNTKGKVPASVWIEKALEGTAGWPAEAMFRMLYLGDKPFREGARMASAYRMFAEQGGGSNAKFRRFMANLSTDQEKDLKESSEEATFSNRRTLSKIADGFVNWVGHNIDVLAEKTPNEGFKHATKVVLKVLAKANTPFVRVPSNLLQYLIELALPAIPLYGSIQSAARGDVRKSAQMFSRAAAGISLTMAADMLYDAGIILASGEDDEENERQLKHEVGRPNGINLDAYARWRAGGDTSFKEGDQMIDFTKLGILGMFFAYRAEFNESVTKELKKSRRELDLHTKVIEQMNSVAGTSLEMSFLQGTYNMFKAFDKGGFQDYGAELMNTLSAIVIPNNVSALTRARGEYVLRADDKEALQGFLEKQSVKLFPSLEDNKTGVLPIIGMFGDPATQTPKGKNPYLYHFFNILSSERIIDPLAVEVFNVSKKVADVPITAPTPRLKIGATTYRMTETDYTHAQLIAGRFKRIVLENQINQPSWAAFSDQEKSVAFEVVNENGNTLAREYTLGMILQGVKAGRITLDEQLGTYSYIEPEEFDFDYANQVLGNE